jgi:hypothetical protein
MTPEPMSRATNDRKTPFLSQLGRWAALQAAVDFFHDLEKAQTELLKQIQVERQRR